MPETFETFVQQERDRLSTIREAAHAKLREAQEEIAQVDLEFRAIEAYEKARAPKQAAAQRSTRAPQARTGSKRDGILAIVKENPDGITRGELLEQMGLKGDKAGEMSVSNALTALTKANQVSRNDGKYVAA